MPKVKKQSNGNLLFWCPGCEQLKGVNNGWTFNGDYDSPTFTPSILTKGKNIDEGVEFVCHSFITNGQIKFLDDCTHKLKGQVVELPDVDEQFEKWAKE